RHEVRRALRVAELLQPARGRPRRAPHRPQSRDDPHRGALRALRVAPGPRVRRRAPDPDGRPVLHELGQPDVRLRRVAAPASTAHGAAAPPSQQTRPAAASVLPSSHAAGGTAPFTAVASPAAWAASTAQHHPSATAPATTGRTRASTRTTRT